MRPTASSLAILRRFHLLREAITGILLAAVLLPTSYSQSPPPPAGPSWWTTRGVIAPGKVADDFAVINQGQLKNMARMAVAEMNLKLTGGAGTALNQMVASWGGTNNGADDFATVNLGQLKAVAAPIQERLLSVGVITSLPAWVNATPQASDANNALANLGQAKSLFDFTLPDQTSIPPEDVEIGDDNLSPFVISYSGWRSAEIHPRLSTDTTELPLQTRYVCTAQEYRWVQLYGESNAPVRVAVDEPVGPMVTQDESTAVQWVGLRNQERIKFQIQHHKTDIIDYKSDGITPDQIGLYTQILQWDGEGMEPQPTVTDQPHPGWVEVERATNNSYGQERITYFGTLNKLYAVPGGTWIEAVFVNENYYIGGVPEHGVRTTLKGPASAPQNSLQGTREISSWDPVGLLATLPESFYSDYALPSRGGIVATAIASLDKQSEKYLSGTETVQTVDRYVGEKATGKVKIKWRTDWPNAVTFSQKQAWVSRYEVTVTKNIGMGVPAVTTKPLSHYLTASTTESSWNEEMQLHFTTGQQKTGEIKITLVSDPNNPGNPGGPGGPDPVDPEDPPPLSNPSFTLIYQMPARMARGYRDIWKNARSLSTGQPLAGHRDVSYSRIYTGGSVAPNYIHQNQNHDYFAEGELNLMPKFIALSYPDFNTYEVSVNNPYMQVYHSEKDTWPWRTGAVDGTENGNPDNVADYSREHHHERQHRVRIKSSVALPLGHSHTVLPLVTVYSIYHNEYGPYTPTPIAPVYSVLNSHTFTIPPSGNNPAAQASAPRESQAVEFELPSTLAASDNRKASINLLKVEIKEVSFGGPNYHGLRSDDELTEYDAPHWVDINGDNIAKTDTSSGEKNYPVAFTRDTKPQVEGKFQITGLPSGQTVKIRAKSEQGLEIPETAVTPTIGGTIILPPTTSLTNLPNSIQFHNADDNTAFQIDWEISIGSGGWSALGRTKHTMYITMADPISTAEYRRHETLFNLGCRNASGKGSSEQAVVDAIYEDFKDLDVRRVKPSSGSLRDKKMTYWVAPLDANAHSTNALLLKGDGKCGAWTRLFIDTLRTQGIDSELIEFRAPEFSFTELDDAIHTEYPGHYLSFNGSSPNASSVILVKNWGALTDRFAPEDRLGISAQGTSNPQSFFSDHVVVKYNGKIYDPSYGADVFATQEDWEDSAIDAFGVMVKTTPALPVKASTDPLLPPGITIWIWKPDTKGTLETIPKNDPY